MADADRQRVRLTPDELACMLAGYARWLESGGSRGFEDPPKKTGPDRTCGTDLTDAEVSELDCSSVQENRRFQPAKLAPRTLSRHGHLKAYILGAGASAHAGYPLASGLLKALSEWLDRFDASEHWVGACRNRIVQVRETFGGLDDFEGILGKLDGYGFKRVKPTGTTTYRQDPKDIFLDCAERMGGTDTGDADGPAQGFYPQYLRSDLITAVREFFYRIEQDRSGEVAYDGFARKIDQDSLVITLNYDVALERALAKAGKWDIGTGYGFTTFADRAASPTAIYKLHGSVNWFQAPMQEDLPPIMFTRDLTLLGYGHLADLRVGSNGVGINNSGTLILPDPQKKFLWECFWSPLWGAAAQRLREAREVFIHGYSMPAADLKARELLFGNINPEAAINIHCRSTSDRLAAEFRDRGFAKVKSFPAVGFEVWAAAEA